jgi:hypothetical protein
MTTSKLIIAFLAVSFMTQVQVIWIEHRLNLLNETLGLKRDRRPLDKTKE